MKRVVTKTVSYECGICKKRYKNSSEAKKCETRIVEKKKFRIGNKVQNLEPRTCGMNHKPYRFNGKVIKIYGPIVSDYEYEVKWLGGKRINWHVFQYEVKFICPHCKEERSELYYAPELKTVRTMDKMDKIASGLGAKRMGKIRAGSGYLGAMQTAADISAKKRKNKKSNKK